MRRNTTFSAGSAVPAATLNAVQDEQRGLTGATENPSGALALSGGDARYVCTPDAGVATGELAVLDDSIDWRARSVWGSFARLESAAQRLHGASAWQVNDVTRSIARRTFRGATGTGAYGAASATVANGTPPVVVSGSFAVVVDELDTTAHRVWLYARRADGALCLYNASGATLHAELLVEASGAAPTPGDPPPDIIPTLTDLLWLTPTAAADRPTSPAGAAIHRATDTGAVTLWDGAAWRTWSASSDAVSLRGTPLDDVWSPSVGDTIRWNGSKWVLVPGPAHVVFATQAAQTYTPSAFPSGVKLAGFVSGATGRWNGELVIHVYQYSGTYYRQVVNGSSGYDSGSVPGNAVVTINTGTGELTVTFPEAVTGCLLATPIVTPT